MDLRRHRRVLQYAVDAVTDRELVFIRLDVNVAGALVYRFKDDFVHQLDHAGFLRHLQQVFA